MDIKAELVSRELSYKIANTLSQHLKFDLNEIANTTAITILSKVQEIIKKDELSDFEMVEKIVCLFEDYNLSCGATHDFG